MLLPTISLYQPWATWVALGWKTIETRKHRRFACLAGRTIAIHAGQKWDKNAIGAASKYRSLETLQRLALADNYIFGAIICTVRVREARWLEEPDSVDAMIECSTRRFGLILDPPNNLLTPVKTVGRQGIFYVDMGDFPEAYFIAR